VPDDEQDALPIEPASSGEPPDTGETDGADLARSSLTAARAEAQRRGKAARRVQQGRRIDQDVRSAAGPDERDPQQIRGAIERLVRERGWETPAAVGGVFGRWPEIVGSDIAAHCRPLAYEDGVLTVVTDSTAWATQIRQVLAAEFVRRLNLELGHGMVTTIRVRGPAQPRWSAGSRSVRGGRGPRDTYG
jgi:predicted nucleic acid-binding Zn ribbon protein